MTDSTLAPIPVRPASQWPVGVRLRFRSDAELNPNHERLRGKPVIVLSAMQLIGPSGGRFSWRQWASRAPGRRRCTGHSQSLGGQGSDHLFRN